MEYFLDAFKQYATFTGRATPRQYWMFVLFYVIAIILLTVIDLVVGTMVLSGLFSLAAMIPSLSIAARRLHDTGRSGWWQLVLFVPLIGLIVMLVFLVQDSHDDNQYGPNPNAAEPILS